MGADRTLLCEKGRPPYGVSNRAAAKKLGERRVVPSQVRMRVVLLKNNRKSLLWEKGKRPWKGAFVNYLLNMIFSLSNILASAKARSTAAATFAPMVMNTATGEAAKEKMPLMALALL